MGVAGNGAAQILGQVKGPGIEPHPLLPLPGGDAIQIGDKVQILDAAHEFIEIRIVGKEGGDRLGCHRVGADVVAVNGDGSLGEAHYPRHRPEGGGLARAVVSDEAAQLPRGDVQ